MKILILSVDTIQQGTSCGKMMHSMFSRFPRENLRQVVLSVAACCSAPKPPCPDICAEYRHVDSLGRTFSLIPEERRQTGSETAKTGGETKASFKRRLIDGLRAIGTSPTVVPFRESLCRRSRCIRALRDEIAAFRPDVVYAVLSNMRSAELFYKACMREKVPLFIHIIDHYVDWTYRASFFSAFWRRRSRYWLQKAVDYASGRAGIGQAMAVEYARCFGGDWTWFTTFASQDNYDPTPRRKTDEIRLLYTGYVYVGRMETLRRLADLLQGISAQTGKNIRLQLRIPDADLPSAQKCFHGNPVVSVEPWVPASRLPELFHKSDILLHVESFDTTSLEFTRLSFSTKISQYMLAGRSILSIGPREQASCRSVEDFEAGILLTFSPEEKTKELLTEFLLDENGRNRYAENGRKTAMWLFERKKAGEKLEEEFRGAVDRFRQRTTGN